MIQNSEEFLKFLHDLEFTNTKVLDYLEDCAKNHETPNIYIFLSRLSKEIKDARNNLYYVIGTEDGYF